MVGTRLDRRVQSVAASARHSHSAALSMETKAAEGRRSAEVAGFRKPWPDGRQQGSVRGSRSFKTHSLLAQLVLDQPVQDQSILV